MTASDDQMIAEYLKRFEEPEPVQPASRFTPEWRAKIAAALRGRRLSVQTRTKMSAAQRARRVGRRKLA